jgi:hypothetical protein
MTKFGHLWYIVLLLGFWALRNVPVSNLAQHVSVGLICAIDIVCDTVTVLWQSVDVLGLPQ